ncbi:MAG: ATPase [Gammaproteobacteria bacterium]|nr:ATPase [Gammaproteobacteria bacterium]
MRMSAEEFRNAPRKSVTLMGMSGVGKTVLANRLPATRWFIYSGDYRIGTQYLREPILDNIKLRAMEVPFLRDLLRSDSIYIESNITVHNLRPISTFLGKLGNPDLGGLPLKEFRRRQELHRDAEARAMRDVASFIEKAERIYGYMHFVNDAGGSICELDDAGALETLVDNTVILYLEASTEDEEKLVERARKAPKPMYYSPGFLERSLPDFLKERNLDEIEKASPDDFTLWAFPRLIAHRRPLYAAIASEHGYTVPARDVQHVRTEADFVDLVAGAIRAAGA